MSNKSLSLEIYIASKRKRVIAENMLKKSRPARKKLVQSRLMRDVRKFENGDATIYAFWGY